jgi:uncharacterized protein with PIN domain
VAEVRFYTDEHVPLAVTTALRLRGVDVFTVQEAGLTGADDEVHLALALSQHRVIFTQDDDFLKFAADGRSHAGMAYAAQQTSLSRIIRGLMLIHQVMTADEMIGKVEFL